MEIETKRNRFFLQVAAVLSTLFTIFMYMLLFGSLSGCVSGYELARLRYAHDVADTTFQTITTTIPRDSVVTTFKTDTTHYFETVRQGRATLTIIREPTNTTVIANCDSLTKSQKVATQITTQNWGSDPKYENRYRIFLVITCVLVGLILLTIVLGFAAYKFTRRYTISPKSNGTAA